MQKMPTITIYKDGQKVREHVAAEGGLKAVSAVSTCFFLLSACCMIYKLDEEVNHLHAKSGHLTPQHFCDGLSLSGTACRSVTWSGSMLRRRAKNPERGHATMSGIGDA